MAENDKNFEGVAQKRMKKITKWGGELKEWAYQKALAYELRILVWDVAKEVYICTLHEDEDEGSMRLELGL